MLESSNERKDNPNVTLTAALFLQRYELQVRVHTLQIYRQQRIKPVHYWSPESLAQSRFLNIKYTTKLLSSSSYDLPPIPDMIANRASSKAMKAYIFLYKRSDRHTTAIQKDIKLIQSNRK